MADCKNCLHFETCKGWINENALTAFVKDSGCQDFADKTRYVDMLNRDFGVILNCAVRYALGRHTYMPSLVVGFITPLIKHLDDKTLGTMWRDLSSGNTDYGNETIDKPIWLEFLRKIENEMKERAENG